AEDGIRDRNVTGVQTCALPILDGIVPPEDYDRVRDEVADAVSGSSIQRRDARRSSGCGGGRRSSRASTSTRRPTCCSSRPKDTRSEERRVGKEGRRRGVEREVR